MFKSKNFNLDTKKEKITNYWLLLMVAGVSIHNAKNWQIKEINIFSVFPL